MNAAASGWEHLARGERVVLGPCVFSQLPNRDGLGGGGGRQDEASRWGQSRCRVWSYGRWGWRSGGHAGAVGGVKRPEAGGDRKSGWRNKPGSDLGPSGGDNRLVMASFAEVANRASGLGC